MMFILEKFNTKKNYFFTSSFFNKLVIVDRVMEDDRIEVTIGEGTKVQIIRSTITSLLKKEEVKK